MWFGGAHQRLFVKDGTMISSNVFRGDSGRQTVGVLINAMRKIGSANSALEDIQNGIPLIDIKVDERISLNYQLEYAPIKLLNCEIKELDFAGIEFKEFVELRSCQIHDFNLSFSSFKKGLVIENCTFNGFIDFQSGGHNEEKITINSNQFLGFISFFDRWFKSDLVVQYNHFHKGTNLLGNCGEPYEVQFEVTPVINDNNGDLDVDGEGI